ncbi:MAG: phosphoribosylformylglycinamidine synthase [Candidatus Doudnabacteria bacterium CG10_big_fil_rev_8_21_14_0_10_42_18]|uniref:Phosphoribosylformylglycinamidine synthase subunit PurL n=1 Tax=Candidatus Doudnabacteria bacterium CG10_big_fil_rev_8_21_14_0_10_42_18 TaxID=1974552 RepID=A0A2H0VBU0_9BACT|nr:MAG: phosphoribosylformylglycinamidine synthase [Candidatus Doudnabacteria bacterium CG10_big_fil_rev_8_21_14_0_10_42_18]
MPFRIEIYSKVLDARSVSKCGFFNSLGLSGKVRNVVIADAYSVDRKMGKDDIVKAALLLTNSLIEQYSVNSRQNTIKNFDYAIEISFLPGVTDNIGNTAKETIEDGLKIKFKNGEGAYSSQVLFLTGKISETDIKKIAESLHNPLIQKALIKTSKEYKKDKGFAPNIAKVELTRNQKVTYVDLFVDDEELEKIGKLGIPEKGVDKSARYKDNIASPFTGKIQRRGPLALSIEQLKVIRDYFHKQGRKPTDVELEALAQTWSEHCKHTIFADPLDEIQDGIYRHYIKRATNTIRKNLGEKDFCVSVFSDNSGGIVFDKDYLITHKVETHNTPSSLDPFGGAITGIVGVNRDCLGFGLGAKPIINTYGFCVAPPTDKTELYRDEKKQNKMLSAKRIFEGVVAGVNAGGNQSGIPTNDGFVYFDKRYRGKPLVFAGTVGLIPRKIGKHDSHIKYPKKDDLIVMLGGRVGLDGIHGATFSSEGLSQHSPEAAVQIGDPITQKKFSDALIREARNAQLFSSITDCGAGGLSSAVGEMAKLTNGCIVNLHKVHVKYPGLSPWQIWISESQERMVLAVPPAKWKNLQKLMQKHGVEATVIGKFTNNGNCTVKYKNQVVMDIDLDFFHDGRPVQYQLSKKQEPSTKQSPKSKFQILHLKSYILNLLRQPNITSYSFISNQYDHEVQGSSVTKPLQGKGRVNSEATVARPVLHSQKGVVLSHGLCPGYSDIDTYHMSACAIDSAVRANVCAGGNLKHMAILDNFCWYSGSNPESLYKLKHAARACFDIATNYNTPFISGKDSMYNDFKGFDGKGNPVKISIPPTLLISAISVMADINKAVTIDAKLPGDYIYILGETNNELGGSEFEKIISNFPSPRLGEGAPKERDRLMIYGNVPKVDTKKNLKIYQALQQAIKDELIASAVSLSRGGLAAALLKMVIAGRLGANINLNKLPGSSKNEEQALFSESQGRILVTANPKNAGKFQKLTRGIKSARLGQIADDDKIVIKNGKKELAELNLTEATKAYHSTFRGY